jgi:cytochrome c oxidase subunit I
MYNESLGKLHFWLMLPAFYLQSLGQMQTGLLGMRRRIAEYDPGLGVTDTQILITVAGYIIGFSMIIFFVNLVYSMNKGKVAAANPWRSRSPEWQLPSPAPIHNYAVPIEIIGEPYDYGLENSVFVTVSKVETPPQVKPIQPAPGPAAAD